jgi:hypothetical protein
MKYKILTVIFLLALLSACSQSTVAVPTPTSADEISTVIALTAESVYATVTALAPQPTETPTPTETPLPVTPLPSPTPTFAPGFTEFAQIRFISPGPMSSLVSPFNLQLLLISGESQLVRVELIGEDGRILYRSLERVRRDPSGGVYRNFEIPFEIRAVSERGFIRISSKDDRGRVQMLNTMPVLLYSVGETQVTPVGNMIYERVAYEGIEEGDEIFGGTLNLKGRFWPFNDQPVFLELVTTEQKVIASRVLDFQGIDTEPFETTLPYKITEPTLVRLSIHQDSFDLANDPELKQYIYVHTLELMLYP